MRKFYIEEENEDMGTLNLGTAREIKSLYENLAAKTSAIPLFVDGIARENCFVTVSYGHYRCKKCGHEVLHKEQFCSKCGSEMEEDEESEGK